jgi:hypothetical protein
MNALHDRHIQVWIIIFLVLVALAGGVFAGTRYGASKVQYAYTVSVPQEDGTTTALQYGAWPALADMNFFTAMKARFIEERAHFVEADLTAMTVSVYRDGVLALTVPVKSKGKKGTWWETPSGLYKAQAKSGTHFSSFGQVYMPYSIPFQGNFFIHGWPYYADGTTVAEGYSGGCIRLADEHAKAVYELVEVGMPIMVHEQDVQADDFVYNINAPTVHATAYLAVDLDTNFVLAGTREAEKVRMPLLSPIMAGLVATEYMNIEHRIMTGVDPVALRGGSLLPGESYRLYDLLFPLLIDASPDVAELLADRFGSKRFVSLMQDKARALGMEHTTFVDATGEGVGNHTTVRDIVMFLKYLRANRSFILNLTAGETNSAVYGVSPLEGSGSVHPWYGKSEFVGGFVRGEPDVTSEQVVDGSDSATVVLAFATSSTPTTDVGTREDMVTVVTREVRGEKRTLGIIVFDSSDGASDTEAILAHLERVYR